MLPQKGPPASAGKHDLQFAPVRSSIAKARQPAHDMTLYIGLALLFCLWAAVSFRFDRMVMASAAALLPILVAGLATVLVKDDDAWEHAWFFLTPWATALPSAAILGAVTLRWLNHHAPAPGVPVPEATRPTRRDRILGNLLGIAYGLLLACGLFAWAAFRLQGTASGTLWHLIFAGLALVIGATWLPFRPHRLAPVLLSFSLATLALAGFSALVYPNLVLSRAADVANGLPFCLSGRETRVETPGHLRYRTRSYTAVFGVSPMGKSDLSLLTIAKPLLLVVEQPLPALDASLDEPLPVMLPLVWSATALNFLPFNTLWGKIDTSDLYDNQPALFMDCLPRPDYAAAPADRAMREGQVLSRRLLGGDTRDTSTWGPLLRDRFRIPVAMQPLFEDRLSRAPTLHLLAPVLEGQSPTWVTIDYWKHPERGMGDISPQLGKNNDRPFDFTSAPRNAFGLYVHKPAENGAPASDGTYAAYRPDGRIRTAILCDGNLCSQSFTPARALWESQVLITVTYPAKLLARWQEIEGHVLAQILALRVPD